MLLPSGILIFIFDVFIEEGSKEEGKLGRKYQEDELRFLFFFMHLPVGLSAVILTQVMLLHD